MTIHCCQCGKAVEARLVNGLEVYPHRPDLHDLPFWKCPACGNHVGCHHKSRDRLRPLGSIPNAEIRQVRMRIHRVLDPLWKSGRFGRAEVYGMVARKLGLTEFHTAEVDSAEQGWKVIQAVQELAKENYA